VKRTVTLERCQPLALGAGVTDAVIVGGVVSAAAAPALANHPTPAAKHTACRNRPISL
jgi:hypothetical protein